MPLSFSNLTGSPANTALKNYLTPSPLSAGGIASLQSKGVGPSTVSIAAPAVKTPATAQTVTTKPVTTAASTGTTPALPTTPTYTPPTPAPAAGVLAAPTQTQTGTQTGTQGPTYSGLIGSLATVGTQGSDEVTRANKALSDFRTNEANYVKDIYSAPTSARVMQGRAQAVQLANAQTENALSTGVQNALTGQGQQITALGTAANSVKKEVSQFGQTSFDPLAGQFSGGNTSFDPATVATQLAQKVLSGQMSYNDAVTSLGYAGAAGSQFLTQAIMQQNPNANIPQLQGQAAATQANTQLAGTTPTATAAAGYQQAVQQYQAMNTSYGAADSQAKTVQTLLANTGINSANSTDYNKALNTLRGRFSSTDYASLSTSLAELQNMYTNLLSLSGGTPSGQEAQALAVLNPNSSASAINASIGQLQTAAYNKLSALHTQATTYQSALGGSTGTGGGTGSGTGGTSVSGFGWNG